MPTPHLLDDPVRASLLGAHQAFADRSGTATRYLPDVGPFAALPADEPGWRDLATLVGPGATTVFAAEEVRPPDGWEVLRVMAGEQYVGTDVAAAPDPEAVVLGPADVPEMLDLVARTRPGPFEKRTPELGTYLGVRQGGRLVALAGERMRPAGWTEISAVCTDPDARGQGLAGRLVRAVAALVVARGEVPFLHVAAENASARRLYRSLGFDKRRDLVFVAARSPR